MAFGKMAALKTLIVGCGYVGTALADALVQQGDSVTGICLNPDSTTALRKLGITPVVADITDADSLRQIQPQFDAIVNCVSSSRKGVDSYREVYLKGTTNLLDWIRPSPPDILVFTSSTTVYAQTQGEWVDETSATSPPHESGKLLLEAERLFLSSKLPTTILRLAAIYGPGRHAMLDKLRAGLTVLPGDGQHWLNLIHRDDIVRAILATLDRKPARPIINVSDDEPVLQADYARWLCERLDLPMVQFDPKAAPEFKDGVRKGFQSNRRVRNVLMKSLLDSELKFPSFREGLSSILPREH